MRQKPCLLYVLNPEFWMSAKLSGHQWLKKFSKYASLKIKKSMPYFPILIFQMKRQLQKNLKEPMRFWYHLRKRGSMIEAKSKLERLFLNSAFSGHIRWLYWLFFQSNVPPATLDFYTRCVYTVKTILQSRT